MAKENQEIRKSGEEERRAEAKYIAEDRGAKRDAKQVENISSQFLSS